MFDLGLLLIRLVVGALLVGHGLQKLAGWFGGPGLATHAETVRTLGYRWPGGLARLHGWAELTAGILLVAGFLTPVAAAIVLAVMLNAIVAVHAPNGLWVQNGGVEYPLVLVAAAVALALTGPGAWSVDGLLDVVASGSWASVGVGAGLVVGLLALAARRRAGTAEVRDRAPSDRPAPAA